MLVFLSEIRRKPLSLSARISHDLKDSCRPIAVWNCGWKATRILSPAGVPSPKFCGHRHFRLPADEVHIIYNSNTEQMDLGAWGNRLREATEALPFKGLDEMAAEDDYVHSDGLNVTRQEERNENEKGMESSLWHKQSCSADNGEPHRPLHTMASMTESSAVSLSESIADEGAGVGQKRDSRGRGFSGLGVLEMESSEHVDEESEYREGSRSKHRFMEDLDSRLARKNPPTKSTVTATLSSSNGKDANSSNHRSGIWIFGMKNMGRRETTPQPHIEDAQDDGDSLPPLSRQRMFPKNQSKSESQTYEVVASSGMLDADDLLALEQIRHLNESQNSETTVVQIKEIIQGHPRECFIAFTLCLSTGVYFYLRSVSNEDDVN